MTRPEIPSATCWVAAILLLLASGVVQGRLGGRWAASPDLNEAVARLRLLPREIGTWVGEDADLDLKTLQRIGIGGGILRRYRDTRTGASAMILLVCGRPGPVSVHTPDVCYGGAGYELAAPPSEPIAGFLAATMIRTDVSIPDRLQVYWSWDGFGRWEVPANPRLTFGAGLYLYKLYVVQSSHSPDEGLASSPAAGLARELTATFQPVPDQRRAVY